MRLKNKVAIVTGGGSGIGRATAELFAREGDKVAVADFKADAGKEVAQAIKSSGREAFFVPVDVSEPLQVQLMVEGTLNAYGWIDILFNGAGILAFGTALDTDEKTWKRVMAINPSGLRWTKYSRNASTVYRLFSLNANAPAAVEAQVSTRVICTTS